MQLARATPDSAKLILYHIPQTSGIPLSLDLVTRLAKALPDRVIAIKDSAGVWDNTAALLQAKALDVLVGDERHLAPALAQGAAGSICGTANLFPERLVQLFNSRSEDAALNGWVSSIVSNPVVPALKSLMAQRSGRAQWNNLRAPLTSLAAPAARSLAQAVFESRPVAAS